MEEREVLPELSFLVEKARDPGVTFMKSPDEGTQTLQFFSEDIPRVSLGRAFLLGFGFVARCGRRRRRGHQCRLYLRERFRRARFGAPRHEGTLHGVRRHRCRRCCVRSSILCRTRRRQAR